LLSQYTLFPSLFPLFLKICHKIKGPFRSFPDHNILNPYFQVYLLIQYNFILLLIEFISFFHTNLRLIVNFLNYIFISLFCNKYYPLTYFSYFSGFTLSFSDSFRIAELTINASWCLSNILQCSMMLFVFILRKDSYSSPYSSMMSIVTENLWIILNFPHFDHFL